MTPGLKPLTLDFRLQTLDFGLWTLDSCLSPLRRVPALDRQHLAHDFFDLKVPFPAFEPAGAEFAAVGAADLGGNAQRVAVARLAVERRVCRDEDALD